VRRRRLLDFLLLGFFGHGWVSLIVG